MTNNTKIQQSIKITCGSIFDRHSHTFNIALLCCVIFGNHPRTYMLYKLLKRRDSEKLNKNKTGVCQNYF